MLGSTFIFILGFAIGMIAISVIFVIFYFIRDCRMQDERLKKEYAEGYSKGRDEFHGEIEYLLEELDILEEKVKKMTRELDDETEK